MNIIIIDYGAGNIKSIQFAFNRLGFSAKLSNDIDEIRKADKLIFPGVGEASSAMKKLKESGLDIIIPTLTQPVLGICLGMQLLCRSTEENSTTGLGVFDVAIRKFKSDVKVPQIGWNSITNLQSDLFKNIDEHSFMYAVHSYYAESCDAQIATTTYGQSYAAALQKDNFYGVQFHPEKSSSAGEQLLRNFINL